MRDMARSRARKMGRFALSPDYNAQHESFVQVVARAIIGNSSLERGCMFVCGDWIL